MNGCSISIHGKVSLWSPNPRFDDRSSARLALTACTLDSYELRPHCVNVVTLNNSISADPCYVMLLLPKSSRRDRLLIFADMYVTVDKQSISSLCHLCRFQT